MLFPFGPSLCTTTYWPAGPRGESAGPAWRLPLDGPRGIAIVGPRWPLALAAGPGPSTLPLPNPISWAGPSAGVPVQKVRLPAPKSPKPSAAPKSPKPSASEGRGCPRLRAAGGCRRRRRGTATTATATATVKARCPTSTVCAAFSPVKGHLLPLSSTASFPLGFGSWDWGIARSISCAFAPSSRRRLCTICCWLVADWAVQTGVGERMGGGGDGGLCDLLQVLFGRGILLHI